MRVVQKFGGTSVGTIEKIKAIAEHLVKLNQKGTEVVVVVSAMGKTTDVLLGKIKEITDTPSRREVDRLLSIGEQESIALLSIAVNALGGKAVSLTGEQAGITTEGIHTKSKIKNINPENIEKYLKDGKIVIVAGFQGVNELGDITTLGRGGSDTSAVALAAVLNCRCEIYTDVDGIYSTDPRLYSNAKKIKKISYDEMMEMSNLGAGVMEVRAVEIGKKFGVPIYVARTLSDIEGSLITERDETMEQKLITGLGVVDEVILVTIKGLENSPQNVATVFEALSDVNIDMISQTPLIDGGINLTFSCIQGEKSLLEEGIKKLEQNMGIIEIDESFGFVKISLVGIGMMSHSGVAERVFNTFSRENIKFFQVTTSEISISLAILKEDKMKAVQSLGDEFQL